MRWLLLALAAGPGLACEAPGVLFFDADPRVQIVLLPEDAVPEGGISVTGTYTATEPRAGDKPLPVGFFARSGEVVSQIGARVDGVLMIEDGHATITRRDRTGLDTSEGRAAMAGRAGQEGLSILQTHLLIDGGELDLRPVEDAPSFTRRLLFQTGSGLGLWQSAGPVTLHTAAASLRAACAPDMALNLDMGSYDFCVSEGESCGLLTDTARLSNLIHLEAREQPDPDGDAQNG